MLKNYFKEKRRSYPSIFISFTVIITAIILILAFVLYISFENIIFSNIYSSEKVNLSQVSYSVEITMDSVKSLILQVYFDKDVSKLWEYKNPDPIDMNKAILKLSTYGAIVPYIQSIYVCNSSAEKIYTCVPYGMKSAEAKSDFYDQGALDIIRDFRDFERFKPIPRKLPIKSSQNEISYADTCTFLFYDPISDGTVLGNAIILNISPKWILSTIEKLDAGDKICETYIIDNKGRIVIANTGFEIMSDISDVDYVGRILKSDKTTGSFVDAHTGREKKLVLFSRYLPSGWIFIRTIPYTVITGEVEDIKRETILIGLLILIAGLICSFYISKKISKPIDNIIQKMTALEAEKKTSKYKLKQDFLKGLLLGTLENGMMKQDFRGDFNRLGIAINDNGSYILILFIIDYYSIFCDQYSIKDRNLFKFAIGNITSEILSKAYKNEQIVLENGQVAVLINTDGIFDKQNIMESVKTLVMDIQVKTKAHLSLSVSAIISSEATSVDMVRKLYDQVQATSHYRMYYGHGCIVLADHVGRFKPLDYEYSVHKEKELLEVLSAGKLENVEILFNEIISSTMDYSYTLFHFTLLRLIFAVNTMTDTIQRNSCIFVSFDFNIFLGDLNKQETIDDVKKHFDEMFKNIIKQLENKKTYKYNELISTMKDVVERCHKDKDLSLDSIAETVGMSPAYISQLFKKHTSKSVVEYINEIRMKKAVELLKIHGSVINEVVELSGYTSVQHFYKVFKRTYGVTPYEFKMNMGKK